MNFQLHSSAEDIDYNQLNNCTYSTPVRTILAFFTIGGGPLDLPRGSICKNVKCTSNKTELGLTGAGEATPCLTDAS